MDAGSIANQTFPMTGSGDPTPLDAYALVLLGLLAVVLVAGWIRGAGWKTRWGAAAAAVLTFTAVHAVTPTTNGVVGAGRLLTLWPALVINLVLFCLWTWRARRAS